MTNKQILKRAIEKAIGGGFLTPMEKIEVKRYPTKVSDLKIYIYGNGYIPSPMEFNIYNVIFSHNFAKAFWGEEKIEPYEKYDPYTGGICPQPNKFCFKWQYHLQQMVLEEDPIKYLEQFL